jgi:hypothetical protein
MLHARFGDPVWANQKLRNPKRPYQSFLNSRKDSTFTGRIVGCQRRVQSLQTLRETPLI